MTTTPPLPRGPLLDWSSFRRVRAPPAACPEDLPNTAFTTSGRAAIYHALKLLGLTRGTRVLVPTYHCPTMIAPVYLAGLQPEYYAIRADGLPRLDAIAADAEADSSARRGAIIVPHYFGRAQSLAEVRRWCDERSIALIEDCAHCYFGAAGERPVGAWGDYSIASLSKFFPVSEAGLLGSAMHSIPALPLARAGLGAQLKGIVDVFELASRHGRFVGLRGALRLVFRLKNAWLARGARVPADAANDALAKPPSADDFMTSCDMARIGQTPLWSSTTLKDVLPRGRVRLRRQRNFTRYGSRLQGVAGAHALLAPELVPTAPYVFPLWVDDVEAVYAALRARQLPVFRWDRVWPGTPTLPGDVGRLWSHHVLQLLCHQDLSDADIDLTANTVLELLGERVPAPAPRSHEGAARRIAHGT